MFTCSCGGQEVSRSAGGVGGTQQVRCAGQDSPGKGVDLVIISWEFLLTAPVMVCVYKFLPFHRQ